MNSHDDETMRFDRRRALQILGAGLGAASGVLALASTDAHAEATAGCKGKVPVDPAAAAVRRNLQYSEKSKEPGKKCSNCAQYEEGKYKECGGCKLFAGAVNPDGNCLSWVAKKTT
ncbi:MAG TPA: high-potential iron-sulfur protein [Myxococcaceae bacterium]|nr:high-potential iron-sulfur protein [Myxococcaceae bacterium]